MKIDINKKYRTRDGREVRLLHRVPEGWPTSYPWRGIAGDSSQLTWTDHGVQDLDDSPNDDDLIEVREPREWWAVLYDEKGIGGSLYPVEQLDGQGKPHEPQIRVREIID